jgi:hypothetical protein
MPINFGQADYYSPKIEIVGKEVPLAALEKTGAVLQDRYDKSYENETKTQALIKKLKMSADEKDKELAEQIGKVYEQRLKERSEKGDFHNMRWQTQQDAIEFADIYTGLSERAKKMQQYRDAIKTYKGINDPNRREYELKKWSESQSSSQFDPENRMLTGLAVTAPQLIDDVNMAKWADTYGKGFESDVVASSNGQFVKIEAGQKIPANGQIAPISGFYDTKTGRKVEKVDEAQIKSSLNKFLSADPEVQSYKNALMDYYVNGLKMNPEEAKFKIESDITNSAVQAAMTKYGFVKDMKESDVTLNSGATFNSGSGSEGKYTPVTLNNPLQEEGKREYSTDLINSFAGDVKAIYNTRNILSNLISQAENSGDIKKAAKYTKYLNDIITIQNITEKYPELRQYMVPNRLDNTGIISLKTIVKDGKLNIAPEDKLAISKISTDVGTAGKTTGEMNTWFDREADDDYENYNQSGFRNISMMQPDLLDDQTRNKIEKLSKGLTIDNFNIPEKTKNSWGDNKSLEIVSWSTEPMGNGVGILFGIKNPKTGEIVYTTPKNRRKDGLIQQISKHLYTPADAYDQMSNLPSPTKKTKVDSLLKTAELSEDNFNIDVNDEVEFENGKYFLSSNPQEKFDSIYQLFYKKINRNG